ncbi:metal-dependent hydrolase [Altererythrobacter aquiaggeris]|uniref:metal-dependent hydrolase n=1 Tax=Aestuarierythrobacter aquiaggeris TaxID=1898396 RepID=UPI0030161807
MAEHKTVDQVEAGELERPVTARKGAGTPEEHLLIVRDDRHCRVDDIPRWWMNNDPVATAWYNSVSASLPRGEAFFVETMRYFKDHVPPRMAQELRSFIRQEVNHSREHIAFNRMAQDHGYDIESIDKGIREMLALTEGRDIELNLAVTITLEHFAACISHELLSDPRYLEKADPRVAEMWRWHSAEEIEHKGITYDVWTHATRDWTAWRRWKVKALIGGLITLKYFKNRRKDAYHLMAQDGIGPVRARWELFRHLWIEPGMMRKMLPAVLSQFLPGFHPWKHDNRKLIGLYESPYSDAVMPAE